MVHLVSNFHQIIFVESYGKESLSQVILLLSFNIIDCISCTPFDTLQGGPKSECAPWATKSLHFDLVSGQKWSDFCLKFFYVIFDHIINHLLFHCIASKSGRQDSGYKGAKSHLSGLTVLKELFLFLKFLVFY